MPQNVEQQGFLAGQQAFLAGQQKTKDFLSKIATLEKKVSSLEAINATQGLHLLVVRANCHVQLATMQDELTKAITKQKIRNSRKRKRGKKKK